MNDSPTPPTREAPAAAGQAADHGAADLSFHEEVSVVHLERDLPLLLPEPTTPWLALVFAAVVILLHRPGR